MYVKSTRELSLVVMQLKMSTICGNICNVSLLNLVRSGSAPATATSQLFNTKRLFFIFTILQIALDYIVHDKSLHMYRTKWTIWVVLFTTYVVFYKYRSDKYKNILLNYYNEVQ